MFIYGNAEQKIGEMKKKSLAHILRSLALILRNRFIRLLRGKEFLQEYLHREDSALLKKVGDEALDAFFAVDAELNCQFDLMFGTLLGAYRDHGFIEHDDDLDLSCDIKYLNAEMLNALRRHGFVIERIYVSSDCKGIQLPMKYKGLTSDIYFNYLEKENNKRHIYFPMPIPGREWYYSAKLNIFGIKDIIYPGQQGTMPWEFNGRTIYLPKNSDDMLKAFYGDNYMTPIKNAHTNPPVRYYRVTEKHYSVYPIDYFENSGMLEDIVAKANG